MRAGGPQRRPGAAPAARFVLVAELAGLVGLAGLGACVDKAPPPLWPAPPPPSVAEVLGDPSQRKTTVPVAATGASALAGPPSPLDSVPVDKASILDPDGPAAAAAAQANAPQPPRPVPTHR